MTSWADWRYFKNPEDRKQLLPYCRLKPGEILHDPEGKHRVGCLDAANSEQILKLVDGDKATLAIQDPPYNMIAFDRRKPAEFVQWSRQWIRNTTTALAKDSTLYIWIGADQNKGFQPLPDFMLMMREEPYKTRSFITMRKQRGVGTPKNWMAVRQELLYYIKGSPVFNVQAEYTTIPKKLRGYYSESDGRKTENLERSKSECIRAGNVWHDQQQVFYRLHENVSGCYAQKPLSCIQRIINASSIPGDVVLDFLHIQVRRCVLRKNLGVAA